MINCGHKDKTVHKLLIVRISHHFTGSQGSFGVIWRLFHTNLQMKQDLQWSVLLRTLVCWGQVEMDGQDKRVFSPSGTWRISTRGLCLKGEIFGWKSMLMWEVKCAEDDRKHLTSEPTIIRPSRSTRIHHSLAEALLSVKSSALWDWAD